VTKSASSRLRLLAGEGEPFRGEGVLPGDADLIYRIGVTTAEHHPVSRIQVEAIACDPPGLVRLSTPFRLMHGTADPPRGFDLNAGESKYPELLDAWIKQPNDILVRAAHSMRTYRTEIAHGTYTVTVKATGTDTDPCVENFRVIVRDDRVNPVRIELI
jgi:hypothetical protein